MQQRACVLHQRHHETQALYRIVRCCWCPALGSRPKWHKRVASAMLGVVILLGWPQAALWVIGLIVAVELIVNGWICIFLALAARRA
jgi:hypothetical protein